MFKFSSRKGNRHTDAPRTEKKARPANRVRANASEGKARFAWAEKVDWGRARIRLVVVIFCLLWTGLWGRAWYLQMIEGCLLYTSRPGPVEQKGWNLAHTHVMQQKGERHAVKVFASVFSANLHPQPEADAHGVYGMAGRLVLAKQPPHERVYTVPVCPQVLRDYHDVTVQKLKKRLYGLAVEFGIAKKQRTDADISDFGFFEVLVLQNKVELFDDVARIDVVV